jgi:hypothetical protein
MDSYNSYVADGWGERESIRDGRPRERSVPATGISPDMASGMSLSSTARAVLDTIWPRRVKWAGPLRPMSSVGSTTDTAATGDPWETMGAAMQTKP